MRWSLGILLILFSLPALLPGQVLVQGQLRPFHRVSLLVPGPLTSETNSPNPFTDFRLEVTFQQGNQQIVVPGHFAADGDAANSGTNGGQFWRVHFSPPRSGDWNYSVSFRRGTDLIYSDQPTAGASLPNDSLTGTLSILSNTATRPDLRARGHIGYDGGRYPVFSGDSSRYLMVGPNSPENFLASEAFDSTYGLAGTLVDWQAHTADWNAGDESWANGRGKGVVGAVNYLAEQGMTGMMVLTMNVEGEGENIWPWTQPTERERFDCSKLDQWEKLLAYANQKGIVVRLVLQEKENEELLDNGELGPKRFLYYREMVSRLAHLPGIIWDLGEENGLGEERQAEDAAWFFEWDPYRHPILLNNPASTEILTYSEILGESPELTGAALYAELEDIHASTLRWVQQSQALGQNWVVFSTDQGPSNTGILPATLYPGATAPDNFAAARRQALYGNLMGGGAGVAFLFGLDHVQNDQDCGDFRSRDSLWQVAHHAHAFFSTYLPLPQLLPADSHVLAGDAWCLAALGETYAVYALEGSSISLQLPDAQSYFVDWYNPRTGGALQSGSVTQVSGPGAVSLGIPPAEPDADWMILVRSDTTTVPAPTPLDPARQWSIFPNPASEQVQVQWESLRPTRIQVRDSWGKRIWENEIRGSSMVELPAGNWPRGMYVVELEIEGKWIRKKLLLR